MAESLLLGRFAQLLNWIHYELLQDKNANGSYKPKAIEPVNLHIFIPEEESQPTRFHLGQAKVALRSSFNKTELPTKLDLETFKFILSQVPAIQTIEFSGWGEPFNNPDIFKMIHYARQSRNIDCHVISHGDFNNHLLKSLFTSGLSHLTINSIAHKPSAFSATTKRNPAEFMTIEKTIEQLLLVRQHYPGSQLFVEIAMVVDLMSLGQIPDMITYAEKLGVDAIRFENYLGNNPEEQSLQTVISSYKKAERFLKQIEAQPYSVQVTLPALLDPDMTEHRFCEDPHTTVSIDEALYISPCSRHLVFNELTHNIWDQDFWNNDQYQWLRSRHNAGGDTVPKACQFCPKNLKKQGMVISPNQANQKTEPVKKMVNNRFQ